MARAGAHSATVPMDKQDGDASRQVSEAIKQQIAVRTSQSQ